MKVLFVVVEDRAFLNQRLNLAKGVKDKGHEVWVASNESEQRAEIEKLGFKYISTGIKRKSKNPLRELWGIYRLYKIFKQVKPELVHNVSIKPVLYGSIAARLAGIKKIVNLINGLGYVFVEETALSRKIFKIFITLFYKLALSSKHIKVIFQNPDDRDYFIKERLIKDHNAYLILGSGVDTEKFAFTPNTDDKAKILFCSRMLWDKGIQYLVSAIKSLKEQGLEFDVTFAGEFDEDNPKSASKQDLSLWEKEGVFSYIGFQKDMPALFKNYSIIVLPSFYREGVPLVLIEAASTGRAIVTTDMPGCREIVENEKNGFLVPAKNSQELAGALAKLIQSKELREKFGRESRELVKQKFSKEIVVEKTLKIYGSFDET